MNIDKIADRANQLTATMSHGLACYHACLEFDVPADEINSTAAIVSGILTRREIELDSKALAGIKPEERYENVHALACEIVAAWAKANGRTGRKNAQTRQSKIRKIVKNGLDSEYARKIIAAS